MIPFLLSASSSLPRHRPAGDSRRVVRAGFTLLELIIAVVVLTTGFVMAALTNTTTMKMMIRDLTMSDEQSVVDEDLAEIRQKAERYTWCRGEGTQTASGSTCASRTPLTRNYYFPDFPPKKGDEFKAPLTHAAIDNFESACNDAALTRDLIAQIGSDVELKKDGSSFVIRRTVVLANLPSGDSAAMLDLGRQTHLLKISYRKQQDDMMDPVEMDVYILPAVAAWCP